MTLDSETTLRLERLIAAPPEQLFALWTEPSQVMKWWAPEGYTVSAHSFDMKPGGRWRVAMRRADGGEVATCGVYRVVDPPHRLTFTWAWENEDGARDHETEVTVIFETSPGGARLTLVQRRFESKRARDDHGRGWSGCLVRIATVAADAVEGENAK